MSLGAGKCLRVLELPNIVSWTLAIRCVLPLPELTPTIENALWKPTLDALIFTPCSVGPWAGMRKGFVPLAVPGASGDIKRRSVFTGKRPGSSSSSRLKVVIMLLSSSLKALAGALLLGASVVSAQETSEKASVAGLFPGWPKPGKKCLFPRKRKEWRKLSNREKEEWLDGFMVRNRCILLWSP